jgi:hypothetical protein
MDGLRAPPDYLNVLSLARRFIQGEDSDEEWSDVSSFSRTRAACEVERRRSAILRKQLHRPRTAGARRQSLS